MVPRKKTDIHTFEDVRRWSSVNAITETEDVKLLGPYMMSKSVKFVLINVLDLKKGREGT